MSPDASDARLSNYRLDRLLGSGGMGEVYLARDLTLNRDVAIKFISPEKAGDAVARRRLLQEARAAAALDHPNICAVYEIIDAPDGRTCIVMQYVEGETLAALLEKGRMDVRLALTIASDVASALAAAHKAGIIHRDLKPQNIIVTPARRAKLLDFGIARLPWEIAHGENEDFTTALTGAFANPGTPMYMSPEQAQKLPLDGRSDLFSAGAVLYECLTGRRAFDGQTLPEICGQVLHLHPPAASSLRPELTDRHDELCRRLLAKHPDDRFQSADELIGALRVLLPDTGHDSPGLVSERRRRVFRPSLIWVAVVLAIGLVAGAGIWRWRAPLPQPSAEAARWYQRGVERIREGAYYSARLALHQATAAFPSYAQAYARMAEADSELDEEDAAKDDLLNVDRLVPNKSRLPEDERLRLEAMRALILRDTPAAVTAYTSLAARHPEDAGVWLDLGRAQEAASLNDEAKKSYERAIAIDPEYAAAHLRLGAFLARQGGRDTALHAYAEAERLYSAASNVEGEAEVLIRRGTLLDAVGDFREARAALERASTLADSVNSPFHKVRAQLRLSSTTASEGHFQEALTMAAAAVDSALKEGLDTVAAEGLVEVATALLLGGHPDEADAQLVRSIELADKHRAQRVLLRAQLQRASFFAFRRKPESALELASAALETARKRGDHRYEVSALSIMARAQAALDRVAEARDLAQQALTLAEAIKDDRQVADILDTLAQVAERTGALPAASAYRAREVDIHRRQNNLSMLAYNLNNEAELLILLGREQEADRLLTEAEAGIARNVDAFRGSADDIRAWRVLQAVVNQQFGEAVRLAAAAIAAARPNDDTLMTVALAAYARARLGRAAPVKKSDTAPPSAGRLSRTAREIRYWECAAALAAGDPKRALDGVRRDIDTTSSYELEWRLAAVGAIAARRLRDNGAPALVARAKRALDRLHAEWKNDAESYDRRPDLVELAREAGLRPGS